MEGATGGRLVAGDTLGDVIRRIGRSAALQHDLTLTDAQLLERFVARHDEPAFAALVARHGPMVLCVCRRLVRDAQEAEDAFQAAFLILARKAAVVVKHPLLAGWLYGVAYRVAVRSRGQTARRRTREQSGANLDAIPAEDASWSDAGSVVHEEVGRLPDAYRAAVILCYLEGKTNEEAACLLRSPVGTVKSRLTRAREMLRSRLTRRGVTASEGMMATALAANPTTATAKLVDTTIRAATRFAARDGGVDKLASARAIALSQGVLRTMMLTKMKIIGALVLAVTMLGGGGAGWLAFRAPAAELSVPVAKADDKSNDDNEAIQGAWKVTGVEVGGKEAPDDVQIKNMKSSKWVITADKITISLPKQGKQDASYKLDATKKPKHLDFKPLDGPASEKGKTGHGVYSLEGDVLKICMPGSPDTDERPTELATKEGGKAMLITLKREKPAKDKPKEDKPEADKQAIQGTWQVTTVEAKGKEDPDKGGVLAKIATQKWVFTADKVTVRMPGKKDVPAAAYTLDPSKTPKEIDVTPEKGKGELGQGLYSLEGDVLKLCFPGPGGGPRPTELAADEAGKNIFLTLKRVAADKDKPKEDKPKDNDKTVTAGRKYRIIGPLKYAKATDVADLLQNVYRDLVNQNPTLKDVSNGGFGIAIAGSQNRNTDATGNARPVTLAIAVDEQSNSLIVNSTQPLFEEIKQLVDHVEAAAAKDKPKEDKPKDDAKVKKLLQDLYQAANEEYRLRKQRYLNGVDTSEQLAGAARRVLTAELERSEKKEDRVTAYEAYLERVTDTAKRVKARFDAGQMTQADAKEAEYYRLEAEIMLEREKAK
jgi:RNA polymerase sigma factor (sigma-70 family)